MNRYCLIQDASGTLLNAIGGELSATASADDSCLWQCEGDHLVHVTGDLRLTPEPGDANGIHSMTHEDGEPVGGAPFRIVEGPQQAPSRHLDELRSQGFTVVPHVMDDDAITRLKADIRRERVERYADESSHDGTFWMRDSLIWSVEVARAASHPVALWIMREYLGTEEIHFCHQPVITTVKPADLLAGTFPESGWHIDYPYHKVLPEDSWPPLGVQFNICVDAFRADNGATQYLPGSHLYRKPPPREFNTGGTRMGRGPHTEVRQWLAPGGAAIIYDSLMWHRTCNELNTSGHDRVAILNAVAPSYIPPMLDKSALGKAFPDSPVARGLTARERTEIERLCCTPARPVPPGMPRLNPRRA